jgi:RNA polymerase sigma-70 factor (ECF subfamily)
VKPTESAPDLARISTQWDLLFRAHGAGGESVSDARRQLLQRYCGAVYRYLLGRVRSPEAAEDLCQEFALRFLRGDFRRADPQRGRFRDFLKTALYHLIVDRRRDKHARVQQLGDDSPEPAAPPTPDPADEDFTRHWRAQLLNCAWEALAEVESRTGQLFYTVLRWRAEHPDAPAADLAGQLQGREGRPFTEAGVRQTLHRARIKFADLLLEEVARSLETSDSAAIEQELVELELLPYCRLALDRRTEPQRG